MYRRFISWMIRHPVWILGITLALTLALGSRMATLRSETDMNAYIPVDDDARTNLKALEEVFGSSYLTRILVVRDDTPNGIYAPDTLAVIARITDWLRTRPEFETESSVDLRSFVTVKDIRSGEDGMVVEPFMDEPPATPEEAAALRSRLEENGIYVGLLASSSGQAAAIMVRESKAGRADRPATYRTLDRFLESIAREGRPERFFVTGRPIVEGLFGVYIAQEGLRMLPIVLAFLAIFLFVSFRTARFVGLCGWRVYSITVIVPVLMTAVAMADSIHLLSRFYELRRQLPALGRTDVIELTMDDMGLPVLMTSVTTIVGFLTMTTTEVRPLRDFGVIAAFGVTAALLLTIVLVPAILALLPLPEPGPDVEHSGGRADPLERVLVATARLADRHPIPVITGFVILTVIAATGLFRLTSDSSTIEQFRPGHHLRKADTIDNRFFAGSSILDVVIEGKQIDAMKEPAMLARIDRLQAELARMPEVGDSFSFVDLIKRMNRVMNADHPEMETVPASRDLVAQYLLLYAISGGPGDFDDLVDYDYQRAHLLVFVNDSGTAAAKRVVHRLDELARTLFPAGTSDGIELRQAGAVYTNAHLERYVISGQLSTLVLGVPAMFLLMWRMEKRLGLALLAITPLSLAIVWIYGTMGLIGLPTDVATTLLGALAIGVGVDFSIHYLYRYSACMAESDDPARAARVTAQSAGRALFLNALVLVAGFATLMTARFYPQVKLGALVSATMMICYLTTMGLFPAVLRLLHGRARPH
jgi:predicted RND superfamily exporter protein